ncbi:MAG: SH3 domain-containing protein [Planctomycetaceae bacterium]|jgi:uncharacterized protein YraI|nr:SH3 domain-containing protein [Planctomycetaceae bacterium]
MTLFNRLVSPIVTTFAVVTVICALSMRANVTFAAVGGVVRSETVSRSGPGDDYYETSRLYSGDRIEIYHEADNGWLAIRPPIGSFSWVGAEYVDVAANSVGTVTAEGLASRIGSEFSDQCQTVSVRLRRGEKVSVVDRIETPENPACKVWLKISPPSGEFRWIRKEDVEVLQNSTVVKTPAYQTNQNATIRNAAINDVTVNNANGIDKVTYQTEVSVPSTAVPPTSLPVSPSTKPAVAILDAASLTPDEEFKRVFEELRQEARTVMTRPTDDWVFEELIKRGNELTAVASNDYDRQKVQHLTEALRRTQTIRREITSKRQLTGTPAPAYQPLPTIAAPPAVTQPVLTPPITNNYVPQTIPSTSSITKPQPTFDQVGRLGRFKPVPAGHPPYALTNERGEVICLITPAPTLDIDALTGQWVGVTGQLGEYTKTGKPSQRHITINSATMLTQGN